MQRYQWTFEQFQFSDYPEQAEEAKRKSRILAKRMVEHARTCRICASDNALASDIFYGVIKHE